MMIEYAVTPSDVAAAYRYNLKHSNRLRLLIFLFALLSAVVMMGLLSVGRQGPPITSRLFIAVIFGAGLPIILPYILRMMTKTQLRTLTLERLGITTTIGSQRGSIPWSAIDTIAETSEYVLITGKSGNAFVIPHRAFQSQQQRGVFLDTARQYYQAATLQGTK